MNKIEEKTISFLKKISKMCDKEACEILKIGEDDILNDGLGMDAFVYSSQIMTIFSQCNLMIDSIKKNIKQ